MDIRRMYCDSAVRKKHQIISKSPCGLYNICTKKEDSRKQKWMDKKDKRIKEWEQKWRSALNAEEWYVNANDDGVYKEA